MTSTIIPAARAVVRRLPDLDAQFPVLPQPRRPHEHPLGTTHQAGTAPTPAPGTAPTWTSGPRAGDAAEGPAGPDRARVHAHLVLRQILEVLEGRRAAAQLAGTVSDPVLGYLMAVAGRLDEPRRSSARLRHTVRGGGLNPERARGVGLRSMRLCHPTDGVAEVSVVWRYRGRFRALAARFERTASPGEPLWRCTALRLG